MMINLCFTVEEVPVEDYELQLSKADVLEQGTCNP